MHITVNFINAQNMSHLYFICLYNIFHIYNIYVYISHTSFIWPSSRNLSIVNFMYDTAYNRQYRICMRNNLSGCLDINRSLRSSPPRSTERQFVFRLHPTNLLQPHFRDSNKFLNNDIVDVLVTVISKNCSSFTNIQQF